MVIVPSPLLSTPKAAPALQATRLQKGFGKIYPNRHVLLSTRSETNLEFTHNLAKIESKLVRESSRYTNIQSPGVHHKLLLSPPTVQLRHSNHKGQSNGSWDLLQV